jgi:hypothetical protein
MKLLLVSIVLHLVIFPLIGEGAPAFDEQEGTQGSNVVSIGGAAVSIPVGRIMLVRKGTEYCAIQFDNAWIEKSGWKSGWKRATYESYYQGDGTGDFSKENVHLRKGEVHLSEGHWIGGGHYIHFWRNEDIRCGPIKLCWAYKTNICFSSDSQEQRDYGIELAPTKWADISKVNVFDQRLKWYRYDEKRQREFIPIDQLWKD